MVDSLDKVIEVTGTNVKRQLEIVVPDFFDRDHVVMQMQPKPKRFQTTPLVKYLWPVVVSSNHPNFSEGFRFDMVKSHGLITDMLEDGFNVLLSPDRVYRFRDCASKEILDERPFHSLVVGRVDDSNCIFGGTETLYSHSAVISYGRSIRFSRGEVREGLCRSKVHFAFLPERNYKEIKPCYIDRGWELKH